MFMCQFVELKNFMVIENVKGVSVTAEMIKFSGERDVEWFRRIRCIIECEEPRG